MINRLRVASQLPAANGISGGFIIDAITKRIKASVKSSESAPRYVRAEAQENKAANFNITAGDDGKTFVFNDGTGSLVASLPKAATENKGMKVGFIVNALAGAGAGHAISPNAADKIVGNGFTPLADKDAICSAASDRLGDYIEFESNGVDTWFVTGVIGTWAREA
jgi:hypothetical protein